MDKIFFDRDLVELNLELSTKEDVITKLSEKMRDKNIVEAEFLEEVLKREKEFPTALEGTHINFAIPHTDPEHVKEAAIAVALLKNKVEFFNMNNYEEKIEVELVLVLAITDASKQVKLLQKLMEIMQDEKIVNKILNVSSKDEMVEIMENNLEI